MFFCVFFRPPVKYFTDRSKAVLLLWIFYCFFFLSCVCYVFVRARLFICAVWSLAGKGLTAWLSFVVSVSLSLSHWYPGSGVVLDVSIPDLCTITYFVQRT